MILVGISHPPQKKLKVQLFRFSKDTFLVDWQITMENPHFSLEIPAKYWIFQQVMLVYSPGNDHISHQTGSWEKHRLKSAAWDGIC